jgi:catechol 2,3-dioxygenase-like lactoylglutathione lyase family enzyme
VTVQRIQLALNVSDLHEAIDFYSKFFKAEPAKVRPGYANFAVDEPPLKLVLIQGGGEPGSINHLGVEVFSTSAVTEASEYFSKVGLLPDEENETTCCYAVQNKVWVEGPDRSHWEVYTVLSDADDRTGLSGDDQCCSSAPSTTSKSKTIPACC